MNQKNKIIIDITDYLTSSFPSNVAALIFSKETGIIFKVKSSKDSFKEIEGLMIPISLTSEIDKVNNIIRNNPEKCETKEGVLEIIEKWLECIIISDSPIWGLEIDMNKESEFSELIMPVNVHLKPIEKVQYNEKEDSFDIVIIKGYIIFNEGIMHV